MESDDKFRAINKLFYENMRKMIDFEKIVRSLLDPPEGHPEAITAQWLCEIHQELDMEEAELYRLFCAEKTITWKGCYGNGSIMWPKWQKFKEEIASM